MTIDPVPEPEAQVITGLTMIEQTAFVTTIFEPPAVGSGLRQAAELYLAEMTDIRATEAPDSQAAPGQT